MPSSVGVISTTATIITVDVCYECTDPHTSTCTIQYGKVRFVVVILLIVVVVAAAVVIMIIKGVVLLVPTSVRSII